MASSLTNTMQSTQSTEWDNDYDDWCASVDAYSHQDDLAFPTMQSHALAPSYHNYYARSDSDSSDASTCSSGSSVDTSRMTKEELRKHKNRESAARSRKRNRDKMEYLEELVHDLQVKNRRLAQTLEMLSYERMGWSATNAAMAPMTEAPLPEAVAFHQNALLHTDASGLNM